MAIQKVDLFLSESDKQLLQIIAEMLLESNNEKGEPTNLPAHTIALSDQEAKKLLKLLKSLMERRDFIESSHFVREIAYFNTANDKRLRELYSVARSKKRRSEKLHYFHWHELKARLGIENTHYRVKNVTPMTTNHFFNMERKLFETLDIHPEIIELLMELAKHQKKNLSEPLYDLASLADTTIIEDVRSIESKIEKERIISKLNLSALVFFISNTSVLFTTRDWSAAGVFSCMMGQAVNILKLEK